LKTDKAIITLENGEFTGLEVIESPDSQGTLEYNPPVVFLDDEVVMKLKREKTNKLFEKSLMNS